MANVSYQGTLFNQLERDFQIRTAFSETLAYGVDVVGLRTPVDTGLLKSQTDSDDRSIFNDTHYSIFQEIGTEYFNGRFYFENSIPDIEREFVEKIKEVF